MKKIDFDVKVIETKQGYKVCVKEKAISTTRNTRVSINPIRFLRGKGLGLRVSSGKARKETKITDVDEIVLDKEKWSDQLDKWCEVEGLNFDVKEDIAKEIRKIEAVRSV